MENIKQQIAAEQYDLSFFGVGNTEPGHLRYGELPRTIDVPAEVSVDSLREAVLDPDTDPFYCHKLRGALTMGLVHGLIDEDFSKIERVNGPEGDTEKSYAAHCWRVMGVLGEMGIYDPTVLATAGLHEYAHIHWAGDGLSQSAKQKITEKLNPYKEILQLSPESVIQSVERYREEYDRRKNNTTEIAANIFECVDPDNPVCQIKDRFINRTMEAGDIAVLRNYIRDNTDYQTMEETMEELAHNFDPQNGSEYNGLAVYLTLVAQAIEDFSFPYVKADNEIDREVKRFRNGILMLMDLYPIAQMVDIQPMYRQIANRLLDSFYPNEWQKMRAAVLLRAEEGGDRNHFYDNSLAKTEKILRKKIKKTLYNLEYGEVPEVNYHDLLWHESTSALPDYFIAISPNKKSAASIFFKLLDDLSSTNGEKRIIDFYLKKSITELNVDDYKELISRTNDVLRFKVVFSDKLADDLHALYANDDMIQKRLTRLATPGVNKFNPLRLHPDPMALRLKMRGRSELHLILQLLPGEQPVEIQFTSLAEFERALHKDDYHPGYKTRRWFKQEQGYKKYTEQYKRIRAGVERTLFGKNQ